MTSTQKDVIIENLAMPTSFDLSGIDVKNADFYTLSSIQVDRVLTWAKAYGYRKPKNANGSTARYFFYLLQRHAINCKGRE